MTRLITWPDRLPDALEGLFSSLAARREDEHLPRGSATEAATSVRPGDAVVGVVDAAIIAGGESVADVLSGVQAIAASAGSDLVFVVGDGYLGTNDPGLAAPMAGAATVAAVRSIAVRRDGSVRANVVCVPAAFFGDAGEQRGPLSHPTDVSDVVEAIAFLVGGDSGYVNGQILFVDGGRHLFSSMSA